MPDCWRSPILALNDKVLAQELRNWRSAQTASIAQKAEKSQPRRKIMKTIPPGSTIGILGGGQLARMTAMAAARLGYRCHIFCADKNEPAVASCGRAYDCRLY